MKKRSLATRRIICTILALIMIATSGIVTLAMPEETVTPEELYLGELPNEPVPAEEPAPTEEPAPNRESAPAREWIHGLNGDLGFNEDSFKTVRPLNRTTPAVTTNHNWWDASVSGNGLIGFMQSACPREDVFILNNTTLVSDGYHIWETTRYFPEQLHSIRVGAITGVNVDRWGTYRNINHSALFGVTRGEVWPRPYMPAAQMRIVNHDWTEFKGVTSADNAGTAAAPPAAGQALNPAHPRVPFTPNENYNRWTNFETGEVGVQWADEYDNQWTRRSFTSWEHNIIVTYIQAPEDMDLNLTLSMDLFREMSNARASNVGQMGVETNNVLTLDDEGNPIGFGMVGKWGTGLRRGTMNRIPRLFDEGGWATATRIVVDDDATITYTNDQRTFPGPGVTWAGMVPTTHYDPQITITDTNAIMLITKVCRIDTGAPNIAAVRTLLYDVLLDKIEDIIDEYDIVPNDASYARLLAPHAATQREKFNTVRVEFAMTPEQQADRELTNNALKARHMEDRSTLNMAWLERVYNAGRFGLLASSGFHSARLGGMWNGQWSPQWSGDFTLNANVNLQISGANTGNLLAASEGYINLIVRMVADWETNAYHVYGMTNAILAPPRVDGTGHGTSFHASPSTWPHMFVNALGDWLLSPIFETYLSHGNHQVRIWPDIAENLTRPSRYPNRVLGTYPTIADVLDLTDEDVARIQATGIMDLERDILYPLLVKNMNFWAQLICEYYFMASDGTVFINGTVKAADGTITHGNVPVSLYDFLLEDPGARYVIAPGYSPENFPAERAHGNNWAGYSLAYNTASDIGAFHNSLKMAKVILEAVDSPQREALLEEWAALEALMPDNMFEPHGAIKEWATPHLSARNDHRHVSHGYMAKPGFIAHDDIFIRDAIGRAMDDRVNAWGGVFAREGHDAMHQMQIEARIKRGLRAERALLWLIGSNFHNMSMTTNHDINRQSSFCTDVGHGLVGGINEMLVFSNTGVIELLPGVVPQLRQGRVQGLRARNNTVLNNFEWNRDAGTASVTLTTEHVTNEIRLLCGFGIETALVDGVDVPVGTDELGRTYVELTLTRGVPVTVDINFQVETTIDVASVNDICLELIVGEQIVLTPVVVPTGNADVGIVWSIADAETGAPFTQTRITADGVLITAPDSIGRGILVNVALADGSVAAEPFIIRVADTLPPMLPIRAVDLEMGFGYYAIEPAGVIGHAGAQMVWKYPNVDLTYLDSINVLRSFNGHASIQFFANLDVAENRTVQGGMHPLLNPTRYYLRYVTVDPARAISPVVTILAPERNINVPIDTDLTGVHDLFVRVVRLSGAWAGNYDEFQLNYNRPTPPRNRVCTWLEGVVITEPTPTTYGLMRHECRFCDEYKYVPIPMMAVEILNAPAVLRRNHSVTLEAVVVPEFMMPQEVIWSSNNPAVATVSQDGVVTARVATGVVVITARTPDGQLVSSVTIRLSM